MENIIFDLGGVIHDIRYENIADEFKKLGMLSFEKAYSQATQTHFIDKFETGHISPEEFRKEVRILTGLTASDEEIDFAWNSILLDVPTERVELLGALKRKYKLFLFSNTNAINYDCFKPKLETKFGFDIFSMLFNKAYMSFQIGYRKPHVEAFEYIIKDSNLNAAETLFIDDSFQHIEGARKAGLKAYWLQKGEDILDLFDNSFKIKENVLLNS